ncbi:MAG TPA: alpha-1,2-fucosyltransferase [Mucilaginibacter sp.]|jgi:hypothetical protein
MIAVRLEGRLGNQLFQYAFIYATAKKLSTTFYMDKSVDYLLLDKYFTIENDFCRGLDRQLFSIAGFKNVFSHYSRWSFYYLLRRILLLKEQPFLDSEPPKCQMNKIRNNHMYVGHFQSEDYFLNYKDDLKRLFSIKDCYRKQFEEIFRSLPKAAKYVTVHIRRGDYTRLNLSLKTAYYHKAIKSIHNEENYYILISDDIDFVKTEFAYLQSKYISENDEITDLQFLMHADICILSNSSFSWWGAWLNNKAHKTVIAHEYWLGKTKELPVNVIPQSWTKSHS